MKSRCENSLKDFRDTAKLVFTEKRKGGPNLIILSENRNSIDKPHQVITFNQYFVNMASDIGKSNTVAEEMDLQIIVNTHAHLFKGEMDVSNVSGISTLSLML